MRITIFLFLFVFFSHLSSAYADCLNPAGIEGEQVYNSTHKTMQFCDGTNWYSMKGGTVTTLDALSCSSGQVIKWNNGSSIWECANDDSGGAESDPQVGTLTNGKWCTTDGTDIDCISDAPTGGINECQVQYQMTNSPNNGSCASATTGTTGMSSGSWSSWGAYITTGANTTTVTIQYCVRMRILCQ